jgi:hypothetical protein
LNINAEQFKSKAGGAMFKNMSIGMRLSMGFGILLALLFVLSIIGY